MTAWKYLSVAQRQRQAESAAEWQRNYPEKRRKINQRYREGHREQERARVARWRERQKEQGNG